MHSRETVLVDSSKCIAAACLDAADQISSVEAPDHRQCNSARVHVPQYYREVIIDFERRDGPLVSNGKGRKRRA